MKERTTPRGAPRLALALKGTLRWGAGPSARVLPVVTRDLGAGGAHCSVSGPVPVGTCALLRLALPEGSQAATLELPCEVVRVDSAGPAEIALAFDEKSSPALEALKRFLVRVRRQSAG